MGPSVTQLIVILVIVIIIFGTKRLRNIGADLGGAIKSFRTSIKEGESVEDKATEDKGETIEGEVTSKSDKD
ncbi:MAG: twin-arginine translocase TatA/TatE family subunit [Methylobacter sp.]|nr:twin-arginine translocase TatA/TatE family subunit [Methylobacter sp.]